MPLSLTIITINFNNKVGLENTIKSVLFHLKDIKEFIVIDGGSSDGSTDIIEEYKSYIDIAVSEKDNGIYHAMNKGIRLATSEYLLFLNSGDFLNPINLVVNVKPYLILGYDIIYGNLDVKKDYDDNEIDNVNYPDELSFNFFLNKSLGHPSTFIKKALLITYGLYEENFTIVSDWAFFIKAICKEQATYLHIPKTISTYFSNGISASPDFKEVIEIERNEVLENNFLLFLKDYNKINYNNDIVTKLPDVIKDVFKSPKKRRLLNFIIRSLAKSFT